MRSLADPVQEFLRRLDGVKQTGNDQWQARCPCHDDHNASLSIKRGSDGRVLLKCHAGCETKTICAKLGIDMADLFRTLSRNAKPEIVARYPYCDEQGNLLYEAVRYVPKDFRQRRPDGKGGFLWNMQGVRRVPYRLPELLAAEPSATVFVVEGEKDADRMIPAGLVATCNVGGAGKWRPEYNEPLRGRRVVVIADKDAPGRKHARQVAGHVAGVAAEVKLIELPGDKVKDAYDWFEAGGTVENLMALVEQAPPFDPQQAQEQPRDAADEGDRDGGKVEEDEKEERLSQSQLLVKLAEDVNLWHDGDTAYATIHVEGHRENHPLNGKAFRAWLARQFWLKLQKVPGAQAMQDALGVLAGKAMYEGEQWSVAVRVAERDGAIYLDLADEKWQVVRVTATGWEAVTDCPIMFIRKRGMLPLPTPVRGGSAAELRPFVNVQDERDFTLILAWLVAALRGRGPYPVLATYGEQGTGKSTFQKMLRALVDPNKSPLRSEPKEPRDLMIAASNSQIIGFDNLSHVATWLSDAMCRLSTGGGFSTRELHSDADEMIFEAMRAQMLNGIEDVATRPDLLDRCVSITLTPISEADRKPEDELWRDFHEAHPRILGALLDAVAAGLANIGTVRLDRLPRMADFAKWVTACEIGLGWTPGMFMEAYLGNRAAANDSAIEGSVIGIPLMKLMETHAILQGIAKELMEAVEATLPRDKNDNVKRPPGWPRSARAFAGELRRIAPNLRAAGIDLTFGTHTRKGTPITLERKEETSSPPSPPSQPSQDKDLRGDEPGDGHDDLPLGSSPASSRCKSNQDNGGDEGDGGDGESPSCSADGRKVVSI